MLDEGLLSFWAALAAWDDRVVDRHFDQLYAHFTATGEMPYGVAKARDGDPHEWITNELAEIRKAMK